MKRTNTKKVLTVLVVLLAWSFSDGCLQEPILDCTTIVEPGIVVEVRDATTHRSIAPGAKGYVRDGAYIDTLQAYGFNSNHELLSFRAADERPGSYEVVVQHDGFKDWHRSDVPVYPGACHVVTKRVIAWMDSL